MKKILVPVITLALAILACGQVSPTPTQPAVAGVTASPEGLWYLVLGDSKSDQAWGVDVDAAGNIYLAAYEQKPDQWFTDMVIYKYSPFGDQLWRTVWGGPYQEKAFAIAVAGPVVFVGGLQHSSAGLTDADMAVLALDAGTGQVEWEFTWGQGFGYEEVDGLVVEEDALYISGWTTSEGSNYDIAGELRALIPVMGRWSLPLTVFMCPGNWMPPTYSLVDRLMWLVFPVKQANTCSIICMPGTQLPMGWG
jgi:hypothetical protein